MQYVSKLYNFFFEIREIMKKIADGSSQTNVVHLQVVNKLTIRSKKFSLIKNRSTTETSQFFKELLFYLYYIILFILLSTKSFSNYKKRDTECISLKLYL